MHFGDNRCVEEGLRGRITPVLIFIRELDIGQMAGHAGHGNCALSPMLTKVEIERVVLDVLVSRIMLQHSG